MATKIDVSLWLAPTGQLLAGTRDPGGQEEPWLQLKDPEHPMTYSAANELMGRLGVYDDSPDDGIRYYAALSDLEALKGQFAKEMRSMVAQHWHQDRWDLEWHPRTVCVVCKKSTRVNLDGQLRAHSCVTPPVSVVAAKWAEELRGLRWDQQRIDVLREATRGLCLQVRGCGGPRLVHGRSCQCENDE